jgi:hypothetical protein
MATPNGTAKPRIRIRDATPADVDSIVDVHFSAFGTDVMQEILYPGGPSESSRKSFGQSLFPPAKEGPEAEKPQKGKQILMVAELIPEGDGAAEKTPEIVAFAKWYYYHAARTEEEWNVEEIMTEERLGEGADVKVFNEFIGGTHRLRKKHSGGIPAVCE